MKIKTPFLIWTLLAGLGVSAASYAGEDESLIAAVVNKDVITQKDVNDRIRLSVVSAGMEDTPEARKNLREQILHALIEETLERQIAKKYELTVAPEEIEDAITHMEENSGSKKGGVRELMARHHIPGKTLTQQVESHLLWLQYVQSKYAHSVRPTDDAIDQEFKRIQDREQKVQYHLAEIVLPIDDQISEVKAREDIARLRKDIQKGAPFSAVAMQFSHAPTAGQGGNMGWLTEDQLSDEYRQTARELGLGALSEPFRTNEGYVILALLERQRPGEPIDTQISLLQVSVPFPFMAAEYEVDRVMSELQSWARQSKSCAALRAKVSKIPGNHIQESGNVSVEQVHPELKKLIGKLASGEKTKPMASEDGATLFMVCERKEIEAQKWSREDVQSMLLQKKIGLLSRRELRDAKRTAFIEIRR